MERIRASEKLRDSALTKFEEQVRAFHTPNYDGQSGQSLPENHLFEYVSLRIGQIAFSNPRVKITTSGDAGRRRDAKAFHHAINRWCRDTNFKRLAEKLAMDYFFSWGVTITKIDPAPGEEEVEDPIYWPSVSRIDQAAFGFDPGAKSYEEARFAFHKVTEDRRELLRMAEEDAKRSEESRRGWKLDAIKKMADNNAGIDIKSENRTSDDSNLVAYYEVWVPGVRIDEDNTPEKGYHGAIFTIAYDGPTDSSAEICAARDYWGPRWGPYTIYGAYTVPGKPWPLAPLMVSARQIDDDNKHADVISRSADNYKRMILVNDSDKRLAKRIKDGKHDFVYSYAGFERGKVEQFEIGGITEEMLMVKGITKDRADRMLGMSDADKGMVTGDATATENAIASNAAQVRGAWQAKKFWDACERNLYSVLWYLANSDEVVMELGKDAERDLGPAPIFMGKVTEESWPKQRSMLKRMSPDTDIPVEPPVMEDQGKGVDDMEITIEIGSMARKDEQREKVDATERLATITNVAMMMPQMPYVKWDRLLDDVGAQIGVPELAEYFDMEMLAQTQQIAMEQMAQQGQPAGGQGSPRISRTQQKYTPDSRSQKAALPGQVSGSRQGQKAQGRGIKEK